MSPAARVIDAFNAMSPAVRVKLPHSDTFVVMGCFTAIRPAAIRLTDRL